MNLQALIRDGIAFDVLDFDTVSLAALSEDGIVERPFSSLSKMALDDAVSDRFGPDVTAASAPDLTVIGREFADGEFKASPETEPGALPVPSAISDRQFAQQLAALGRITETEALAWAARGELPAPIEAAIAELPADQRFGARMLLSSATSYVRDHPLVGAIGTLLNYDSAAIDDIWRAAAAL